MSEEDIQEVTARFETFVPSQPSHFMPWLAVLSSQGIPYQVQYVTEIPWIMVPMDYADRARREIEIYEANNRDWPPHVPEDASSRRHPLVSDAAFVVFLAFFAGLLRFYLWLAWNDGQGKWRQLGIWDNGLVHAGEWWRSLTALTLHADGPHVLSNVFWGFALGSLVGTEVGAGAGVLSMVLSGWLGNAAMGWIGLDGHRALGASTMVFGALGVLAALHTVRAFMVWRSARTPIVKIIPWTPLLAGVAMTSLYGTAPGSDLMGHALGFISGTVLGCTLYFLRKSLNAWLVQFSCGTGGVLLLVWAWILAILS